MAMQLAEKFSSKVDERFEQKAYSQGVCGNAFDFDGVKTVKVYDMAIAPLQDYDRTRTIAQSRYGNVTDLQAAVQTMTVGKDKSFTFAIDRKDLIMSQAVMEANRALSRQINQSIIPAYDAHVFQTLASRASGMGNLTTTTPTKNNAYEMFLSIQEFLGNHLAPAEGRIAICSYRFANLLKQDPSFVLASEAGMQVRHNGDIGMVDGVIIRQVPSSVLPNGCACIVTHPFASVAPKKLEDYKIHDDPPGHSGYLVEGRFIYDCFVLDNKVNGIYYVGSSGVLRVLNVISAPSVTTGKCTILVSPDKDSGNTWVYKTGASLTSVAFGDSITAGSGGWTAMNANGLEITPTSSHTYVQVVELDSEGKAVGEGRAKLNVG